MARPFPRPEGNPGASHAALKGAREAGTVSGVGRLNVMNNPTGHQGSVTGIGAGTRARNDKFAFLGKMSSIPAVHLAAGVEHQLGRDPAAPTPTDVASAAVPAAHVAASAPTPIFPGRSVHLQGPPAPPTLDGDAVAKRRVKLRAALGRVIETGQTTSEALGEIQRIALLPKDVQNPFTRAKRQAIIVNWTILLEEYMDAGTMPRVPESDYWLDDVVVAFATTFLRARVMTTPGIKGAQYVKAITLRGWQTDLIHAILKHTYNKATGESAGISVLVSRHLHDHIEDEVAKLVDEFQLDRTRNPVHYFGRAEVQMMIACAMKTCHERGHQVKLQTISALLISFYLATRSSSLAACAKQYRANQRYMKLKHIEIQRVGAMDFIIKVHVTEWKGHNTSAKGKEESYTLESVVNPHNVVFDVTLWLIAYLWSRKCFGDMTLHDIYTSESSTLDIDENKLEEPLFLMADVGGVHLTDKPTLAGHISMSFRHLSVEAGLPAGGAACIRRGAADHYGIRMGKILAALIIGHRDQQNVFTTHYSRNLENLPLVSIRLGELHGDGGSEGLTKAAMKIHNVFRDAVTALLHINARAPAEPKQPDTKGKGKAKKSAGLFDLTQEDRSEVNSDLQLVTIKTQLDSTWPKLIALYPTCKWVCCKSNLNSLFKEDCKFQCTDIDAAQQLRKELLELLALKVAINGKVTRKVKCAKKRQYQEQLVGKTASFDTYKDRAAASRAVDDTSDVARELISVGLASSVASGSRQAAVEVHSPADDEAELQLVTPEQAAELLGLDDDTSVAEQESVERTIASRPDSDDPQVLQEWTRQLDARTTIVEEEVDSEQLASDVKDTWNALPLHFRKHVKTPAWVGQGIASHREPEPEGPVNEKQDQNDDPFIDGDNEVGFLDESGETNVFALPRELMALYFMQGILAPIIDGAAHRKFLDEQMDESGSYACAKPNCTFSAVTKRSFLAHTAVKHSEWEELLQRMSNPDPKATDRTKWLCPCGDKFYERNRTKVIDHCLSSACCDFAENVAKKATYDQIREKYPPEPPSTTQKKKGQAGQASSKGVIPSAHPAPSSAGPSTTKRPRSTKQKTKALACEPAPKESPAFEPVHHESPARDPTQHEPSEGVAISTPANGTQPDGSIYGPPPGEWVLEEIRSAHGTITNVNSPGPSFTSIDSTPMPPPLVPQPTSDLTSDMSFSDVSSVLDPTLLLNSSTSSFDLSVSSLDSSTSLAAIELDPRGSMQQTLDQLQAIGLDGIMEQASAHRIHLPDRFGRVFHLLGRMPDHLHAIHSDPSITDQMVDELGLVSEDEILHDRVG